MAGKRKAPLWRQVFLRALRRTGNVRTSAFEAGVDPGTAYDHRAKDAGFRGKWDGARAAFKPPSRKASADKGEELVLRRSKHGDKLVRAAPGRWSARVEESFLDALALTGCVRTAAASVRMSTTALYKRRDHYPEFRARWDERTERFREQLPALVNAAAVESLSPEGVKRRGRTRLPKFSAGDLVRVYAINENARAKAERGGGRWRPPPQLKDHKASILKKLGAMHRKQCEERLAAGWIQTEEGDWIPPGWVRAPATETGTDE